jgi:hypothetical protein
MQSMWLMDAETKWIPLSAAEWSKPISEAREMPCTYPA